MPRFMANDQITDAARDALALSLTIMGAISGFIVRVYRSTFLCFLELLLRGLEGPYLIIGSRDDSFLRKSMQNDVAMANSAIQTGINKVNIFVATSRPLS
jgi:hypothetical protein